MLSDKKFVLILADQIAPRNLAYTGALLGFQFGRKVPEMVGRDQLVPSEKIEGEKRKHLGITTQNLPVLNGLSFENMRAIRESLNAEKELLVTEVTEAAATSASYSEYVQAIATVPRSNINYWGIGIFGPTNVVNKYTQGLKLYGKPSKIEDLNPTIPEPRLIGNDNHLPCIRFILANNLSGGVLANSAAILGVTYGRILGERICGPDLVFIDGSSSPGLPMVDLAMLNGHPSSDRSMRELRESLHSDSNILVVDVTDATSKTRSYDDYLELSENTPVLDTVYQGVGLCGSKELVAQYTKEYSLFIMSNQEQALLKKQMASKKWGSSASAATAAASSGKSDELKSDKLVESTLLSQAAATNRLGWQQEEGVSVETKTAEEWALRIQKMQGGFKLG